MRITYSECSSVTLVIQYAKCMKRNKLSSVACLAVQYISHYLINGTIKKKMLLKVKCVFDFLHSTGLKHFSSQKEFSKILS